ncbi:RNA polymerase sigma factor [Sphingobacterium faecale]|uniref:Sigma-70 family RNA polymerase sigma factor n=1 Tax=Sphingobacterium faecale TaxID=2803775 RepID=A0ABS1QYN1_9SPHI|nr:sigma-70 family RNA polymerase sigma factor [Sphingobacterium faecale]MBL1407537.1 sigma-70 family RNA polymerase sigma factor [Sphingobacterium faecale]
MKPVVTDTVSREDELLSQLRGGDYAAYHQLYDSYSPMIMARIRRLVLDQEIALELHQEVFLQIWNERKKLPADVPFKAILLHRAKLQAYKYYHKASQDRDMRAHLMTVATELYDQLQEQIDFQETNASLLAAIAKLPEQRRRVFVRIKLEGRSYEEAADEFGVSVSTIKDHMTRALKFLRTELTQDNPSLLFFLLAATLFR